jgi:hypothetical protein
MFFFFPSALQIAQNYNTWRKQKEKKTGLRYRPVMQFSNDELPVPQADDCPALSNAVIMQ